MATSTPNHGLYKYGGDDSPDLTKLGPTMDKIDLELKKNADNIGLLNGPIPVTWASGDSTWNYKPTGRYFIGGDGLSLGYPTINSYIDHMVYNAQMTQSMIAGSTFFFRRVSAGGAMAWRSVSSTAVT